MTSFQYNDDSQRTKTSYPNDVVIDMGYDTAQRLETIKATKSTATLQDLAYTYRQPGTSGRQTPLRQSVTDNILRRRTTYTYDGLDRLRQARGEASTVTPTAASTRCTSGVTADGPFSTATPVAGQEWSSPAFVDT